MSFLFELAHNFRHVFTLSLFARDTYSFLRMGTKFALLAPSVCKDSFQAPPNQLFLIAGKDCSIQNLEPC